MFAALLALIHHTWVLHQICVKDCAVTRYACNGNCVGTTGRKSNLNVNPTHQTINLVYVLSFPLLSQGKVLESVQQNMTVFMERERLEKVSGELWGQIATFYSEKQTIKQKNFGQF